LLTVTFSGSLFFNASGFIIGFVTDQADLSAGQFMVTAASGFWGQAMQPGWGSHLISADQFEFAAGRVIYMASNKVAQSGAGWLADSDAGQCAGTPQRRHPLIKMRQLQFSVREGLADRRADRA